MGRKQKAELDEIRSLAKADLFYFARYVLGYDRLVERVHGPVCALLQNTKLRRVNITMPRGFYKSTLASVAYPLWDGINDPETSIMVAMNTLDNAKFKLAELKSHVERNEFFRGLFHDVIPHFEETTWRAESACLKRERQGSAPTFMVAGVGTSVISRHPKKIVMDDLVTVKRDDLTGDEILPGKKDIQGGIHWFDQAISLLDDPKTGRLINVGTRWAVKDVVTHVLESHISYRKNSIELRARDVGGNPSFPEWYPDSLLQEIEGQLGSTLFQMWYMNEPIDPTDLVFQLDPDSNYYRPAQMPEGWLEGLRKYTTVDPAFSDSERADNTAILTVGVDAENVRYVLDLQYGKFSPMETINLLFALHQRFQPRVIGIEAVAAQAFLPKILPHFMKQRDQALPIREIQRNSRKSQENRIMAAQPWVQQGMVKLPVGLAKPLEVEMRDYRIDKRRSGHDDALSALSDVIEMSQTPHVEPVKERTKYGRDFMDRIRERLYSAEGDIEKSLTDEGAQRGMVGARKLIYAGN